MTLKLDALAPRTTDVVCTFKHGMQKVNTKGLI